MWNNAQIYFVNAVSTLPKEQREPTKKAFMHMAKVMHDIVRNEDITKTDGNSYTQDKRNLAARRVMAAEVQGQVSLMESVIRKRNAVVMLVF